PTNTSAAPKSVSSVMRGGGTDSGLSGDLAMLDSGGRFENRPYMSSKQMLTTSYSTTLAGVLTSTVSPTRLPMRARPTGDWTEILPFFRSPSSGPTSVYRCSFSLWASLTVTVEPKTTLSVERFEVSM